MIEYSEIDSWERFEELCEELLKAEGLTTRRLGRGPGQVGKDVIANESFKGILSDWEKRDWLVECKYTNSGGAIDETHVMNVRDRVEAQKAYGYMLFTNARLRVNLEKTLNGLKKSGNIGIEVWTSEIIARKVVLHSDLFRNFFPDSFKNWINENRLIYINQINNLKSPLVHTYSCLQFMKNAPGDIINIELRNEMIEDLASIVKKIIDDLDEDLQILRTQDPNAGRP
ncbi:restriction endonuclease [Thermodesulfobacteriota bacterium]